MKTTRILLLIGASLALASTALANQIQVGYSGSSYGPYQSGVGGEFTLNDINGTPANSWLDLSGYVADKTSNFGGITSFQTFCVEENEYIYPHGAIYDVQVSDSAVNGGLGGGNPDPVSLGTSWLYNQYSRGVLPGYTYTGIVARKDSAALLQNAIWWLEQEGTTYTDSNIFMLAAYEKFGGEAGARANGGGRAYGVYVLNLTGVDHAPIGVQGQDQLYYAPDGGTTLALLGIALCGMSIVWRRFRSA